MHWRLRRALREFSGGPAAPADELVETFMSGSSVRATTYVHQPTGSTGGPEAWRFTEDTIRTHIQTLREQAAGGSRRRPKSLFAQLWFGLFPHLDPDRDDLADMAEQLTAARSAGDTRSAAEILGYDDDGGYSDDLE